MPRVAGRLLSTEVRRRCQSSSCHASGDSPPLLRSASVRHPDRENRTGRETSFPPRPSGTQRTLRSSS
ncbi:hypothetical protein C8039_08295 [Halogeometricum sp. wsp3]|nr:hypothetical protein C8039_08295 [Halogeometricum sp. wsp3]